MNTKMGITKHLQIYFQHFILLLICGTGCVSTVPCYTCVAPPIWGRREKKDCFVVTYWGMLHKAFFKRRGPDKGQEESCAFKHCLGKSQIMHNAHNK